MKSMLPKKIIVFSDGGSRGNPGPSAYGFVVYDENNEEIFKGSRYLEVKTNNQAEYSGVLGALEYVYSLCANNDKQQVPNIKFYLDSKLIVEQMNGNYKIKSDNLKTMYWQIRDYILKLGGNVVFEHVPREKNKVADKLVNIEIDKNIKKIKN